MVPITSYADVTEELLVLLFLGPDGGASGVATAMEWYYEAQGIVQVRRACCCTLLHPLAFFLALHNLHRHVILCLSAL
jgi:hypothetical protein